MISLDDFKIWVGVIYLSVLLLICFMSVMDIFAKKIVSQSFLKTLVSVFSIAFIVLFGLRGYSVGIDTFTYKFIYESFDISQFWDFKDLGFAVYICFFSGVGFRGFLLACAVAYILPLIIVLNKFTKYKLYLFYALISLFSFYSLGINILRQGIAISLSMLALCFYVNQSNKKALLFFILGFSFHSSVILIPVFSWLVKHFLNLKKCLWSFLIASLFSVIGERVIAVFATLPFFDRLYEDRLSNYIEGASDTFYQVGFRLDFFIFNLFFVLLGIVVIKKLKNINKNYIFVYNVYLLLSSVFVLFFNVPYSDRTGVLSWILIPYIQSPLVYKSNKYRKLTIPFFIFLNVCMFYFLFFI